MQRANEPLTVAMVAKPAPQPPVALLHCLSAQPEQLADLLPPQTLCPDRSQQLVPHSIERLVRLVERVERLAPLATTSGRPDLIEQPNKVIKIVKRLLRVIRRQFSPSLPVDGCSQYDTRARYRSLSRLLE
jgi:hypothetical protein